MRCSVQPIADTERCWMHMARITACVQASQLPYCAHMHMYIVPFVTNVSCNKCRCLPANRSAMRLRIQACELSRSQLESSACHQTFRLCVLQSSMRTSWNQVSSHATKPATHTNACQVTRSASTSLQQLLQHTCRPQNASPCRAETELDIVRFRQSLLRLLCMQHDPAGPSARNSGSHIERAFSLCVCVAQLRHCPSVFV
jgi:hypothetical protein